MPTSCKSCPTSAKYKLSTAAMVDCNNELKWDTYAVLCPINAQTIFCKGRLFLTYKLQDERYSWHWENLHLSRSWHWFDSSKRCLKPNLPSIKFKYLTDTEKSIVYLLQYYVIRFYSVWETIGVSLVLNPSNMQWE